MRPCAAQEYVYTVCPFANATQGYNQLGRFDGWEGGGGGDARLMRFRGGDMCWNGPARSMDVAFECGAVNELLAVRACVCVRVLVCAMGGVSDVVCAGGVAM